MLRTSQVVSSGISKPVFYDYVRSRDLDRVAHGIYLSKDSWVDAIDVYKRQPYYLQRNIEVKYSSFTAEWQITGKTSVPYSDVAANTTYGTLSLIHI